MDEHARHGVTIDHCPACGGVWLGKGELDHLMAAVRPAVHLRDPDPARPDSARPDSARPAPQPEPSRATRYAPRTKPKPDRDEDRGREARKSPGKSHRYGRKYSQRARLKDVLEEIFDFD